MADLPPACKDVLAAPDAAGQSGERELTFPLVPAKAGTQSLHTESIPACAGMSG